MTWGRKVLAIIWAGAALIYIIGGVEIAVWGYTWLPGG
jgi:hypothetical protein